MEFKEQIFKVGDKLLCIKNNVLSGDNIRYYHNKGKFYEIEQVYKDSRGVINLTMKDEFTHMSYSYNYQSDIDINRIENHFDIVTYLRKKKLKELCSK